MKKVKKIMLAALACAFVGSLSLGAANALATAGETAQIDESKFQMLLATSVRIGDDTLVDPTGIRFKTVATQFKSELEAIYPTSAYDYNWYTQLRVHLLEPTESEDGVSAVYQEDEFTANVQTAVWHDEGWNTLLLGFNNGAFPDALHTVFGTYIAAQSFVEITEISTGETVYEASTHSSASTAAYTASWALNSGMYEPNANDTAEMAQERAYARSVLMSYVTPVITSVAFTRDAASVWVGSSEALAVKTQPAHHGVIYSSSDESVAIVDSKGKVTGLKAGTATISATMGDQTDTCTVTVFDEKPAVADFEDGSNNVFVQGNNNTSLSVVSGGGNGSKSLKATKGSSQEFLLAFDADYLKKTFAVERVASVQFEVYGLDSQYVFRQMTLYWSNNAGEYYNSKGYIHYVKTDTGYTVTVYREGYEKYLETRASESAYMMIRIFFTYANDFYSSSWASIQTSFYVDDVRALYEDSALDFEDGYYQNANVPRSAYITVDATASVVEAADRTMGRGDYALAVTPENDTLQIVIEKTYLDEIFVTNSANYLQFRVYTQKDITKASTAYNATTTSAYIDCRYQADGYYAVRIGKAAYESWVAANQEQMTIALQAQEAFGTVYIDAFEGKTDKTVDASVQDMTYTERVSAKAVSAPTYQEYTDSFNPYAYSSIDWSEKLIGDVKIYYDAAYDKASLQTYKDAGYQVIMPQTSAQVVNNGANSSTNAVEYQQLLADAAEVGLKVLLTDGALWWISERTTLDDGYNYHLDNNGEAFDLTEPAPTNSIMYDIVKSQLGYYINYSSFYGVVLRDEPTAQMLQTGIYGCLYRTIKEVAKTVYGKDIYIHANQIANVVYSALDTYYPELSREEYCNILGVELTSDLQAMTDSEFDAYVNGRVSNYVFESATCEALRAAIIRARYQKYLELFLDTTGADYLMPDLYPLYQSPAKLYMQDLQTTAQVAAAYGVDVHVVSQTMSLVSAGSSNDRVLSENDLRWINNTLLSFGVKNIVYYTYCTRGGNGGSESYYIDGSSPLALNGEPTYVWYAMQKLLRENQAFASTYLQFDLTKTGVYDNGCGMYNTTYLQYLQSDTSYAKLTDVQVNGEATLVSELYDSENGNYMYAVLNAIDSKQQSIGAYQSVTLTFAEEYNYVVVWRNGARQLMALDDDHTITVENAAGEAVYLIPYYQFSEYYYDAATGDNCWFFS